MDACLLPVGVVATHPSMRQLWAVCHSAVPQSSATVQCHKAVPQCHSANHSLIGSGSAVAGWPPYGALTLAGAARVFFPRLIGGHDAFIPVPAFLIWVLWALGPAPISLARNDKRSHGAQHPTGVACKRVCANKSWQVLLVCAPIACKRVCANKSCQALLWCVRLLRQVSVCCGRSPPVAAGLRLQITMPGRAPAPGGPAVAPGRRFCCCPW